MKQENKDGRKLSERCTETKGPIKDIKKFRSTNEEAHLKSAPEINNKNTKLQLRYISVKFKMRKKILQVYMCSFKGTKIKMALFFSSL